ncbi:MAG: hypothetical protein D6820_15780 [Lentisphaerae bacterium]|nr:MAG: hypothetical protein D6820_15780 [Lentisphaerota bacterium]
MPYVNSHQSSPGSNNLPCRISKYKRLPSDCKTTEEWLPILQLKIIALQEHSEQTMTEKVYNQCKPDWTHGNRPHELKQPQTYPQI